MIGRNELKRIRFTQAARRDLAEIYLYIANDSIAAADKHRDRLTQRCLALIDQPRIGSKRDNIRPGLRSLAVGDYAIFYRVENKGRVAILRVVHCKRDLSKIDF